MWLLHPIDRFNERYEELQNHPDWSFYGKDFPPKRELLEARNRVVARHPKTTFIGLHVANDRSAYFLLVGNEKSDTIVTFRIDTRGTAPCRSSRERQATPEP